MRVFPLRFCFALLQCTSQIVLKNLIEKEFECFLKVAELTHAFG